jgi:hypothetical protein
MLYDAIYIDRHTNSKANSGGVVEKIVEPVTTTEKGFYIGPY